MMTKLKDTLCLALDQEPRVFSEADMTEYISSEGLEVTDEALVLEIVDLIPRGETGQWLRSWSMCALHFALNLTCVVR